MNLKINISLILVLLSLNTFSLQAQNNGYMPIKRSSIINELDNLPLFLTSFTARPYFVKEECIGIEISNLGSNEMAKKMNLNEEDILVSIDNIPLNNITDVISYYTGKSTAELSVGRTFKLLIIRERQKKLLNYIIVK